MDRGEDIGVDVQRITPTLLVWWRYGKEHGQEECRCNEPEVVEAHLHRKIDPFRRTPQENWRWFQAGPDLIVEKWEDSPETAGPDTHIYYLLDKGLAVIENVHFPPPDDNWKWYIHIADFEYSEKLGAWLMKDLFVDLCIEPDNHTYQIFDLPDLACALDAGLISHQDSRRILERVDWLVKQIVHRKFPLEEIEHGREACRILGWRA